MDPADELVQSSSFIDYQKPSDVFLFFLLCWNVLCFLGFKKKGKRKKNKPNGTSFSLQKQTLIKRTGYAVNLGDASCCSTGVFLS